MAFTEAQRDALAKSAEILSEHFDGFLLGIQAGTGYKGDKEHETIRFYWHGGTAVALGLANMAAASILKTPYDTSSDPLRD